MSATAAWSKVDEARLMLGLTARPEEVLAASQNLNALASQYAVEFWSLDGIDNDLLQAAPQGTWFAFMVHVPQNVTRLAFRARGASNSVGNTLKLLIETRLDDVSLTFSNTTSTQEDTVTVEPGDQRVTVTFVLTDVATPATLEWAVGRYNERNAIP